MSPPKAPGLPQLARFAIARSLFRPTMLPRAVARLGFVQADPMRAPARAQDLILAHRVEGYRAGDLERRYPSLPFEEAFFCNYGFVPRETLDLLYPRETPHEEDAVMRSRARKVLAFVRRHGLTRPRDVQAHFNHGRIQRWGAQLSLSVHLLESLHHRGLVRVARREAGARIYEAADHPYTRRAETPEARLERAGRLLDVLVGLYAPLPAPSLAYAGGLLRRYGVPNLADELRRIQKDGRSRYAHAEVDGLLWFWPRHENPASARHAVDERLLLLSPFDPVVWDRRRFQMLWGWEYKLEAYVAPGARRLGHYAMPMLWRDEMIGWANLKVVGGRLRHRLGFIGKRPRSPGFDRALEQALYHMREFLNL